VRLTPAGAYAVLALPMAEVSGLVVDLRDVIGRAAGELAARCRDAASVEERFGAAVAWVSERVRRGRRVDPWVAWTAAEIERSAGGARVAALRRETGYSKTRFVAAFREQIGLAPKLYARIVRFRRVLAMLETPANALAEVALATGYYDQPHMNAEFREFAGVTPRQFLATRFPGAGSLPGAGLAG
jgi:AraC-like DNA-binding protein